MVRPLHPKERPVYSRRAFLQRAAAAGIAMPSLAAILAACGSGAQSNVADRRRIGSEAGRTTSAPAASPAPPYPLARPDAPVTWNVDPSKLIDERPQARRERDASRSCAGPTTSRPQ